MSPDSQETHAFRSNINPLLRLAAGIAAVGPVVYVAIYLFRGDPPVRTFDSTDFLLSFLASCAVGMGIAAIAMILRHFSVVRISPAGLHCDGRSERNHFIAWPDMPTVQPFELNFGLRYLLIRVPCKRDWAMVPRFVDTVEEFAGSENALLKELRGVTR